MQRQRRVLRQEGSSHRCLRVEVRHPRGRHGHVMMGGLEGRGGRVQRGRPGRLQPEQLLDGERSALERGRGAARAQRHAWGGHVHRAAAWGIHSMGGKHSHH